MKIKICNFCNACKCLYERLWYSYWRVDSFYCTKRDMILQNKDGCEFWQEKTPVCDLSDERFERAFDDIRFLLQRCGEETETSVI